MASWSNRGTCSVHYLLSRPGAFEIVPPPESGSLVTQCKLIELTHRCPVTTALQVSEQHTCRYGVHDLAQMSFKHCHAIRGEDYVVDQWACGRLHCLLNRTSFCTFSGHVAGLSICQPRSYRTRPEIAIRSVLTASAQCAAILSIRWLRQWEGLWPTTSSMQLG